MAIEVGRVVVKTAGRDAANYAVVVEVLDDKYVTIDGNVRRKKVNMHHIEPLNKTLDIKKGATTKDVLAAFEKANIVVKKKVEEKKKSTPKPQVKKVKKVNDSKDKKKSAKAEK
jgi:large subunit ribosomal protein L14e